MLQGGLLETDLYDMPKGFEAKDVLEVGSNHWKEQLKLPAEERHYGKGADTGAARRAESALSHCAAASTTTANDVRAHTSATDLPFCRCPCVQASCTR